MKKESKFQSELIKEIGKRFEGSLVLKNDPNYVQGIPDLTVLYKNKWAMLENKRAGSASHRPNQDYYVTWANKNSFGAFINPENKVEVLDELERFFGT